MEVTEIKSDGLKREYKVVVPADDIEEKVENRLQEISHRVTLPGFRPGKVPMSLMRKRYGSSVMGEVLEEAVNESSRQAMEENDLRPAVQPKIEVTAFSEGQDLEYTMALEVMPPITPMDFSQLKLERLVTEVGEAEVDKALEGLAERHKRFEPPAEPRPAREGDQVVVDFVGRIDGEPFEGGSGTDVEMELGSGRFVPGFEEQLVGAAPGDERQVKISFPAEYAAAVAGKDAVFDVTVKEVRAPVPVAIDDALAKELGMENLEALKATIRDQLGREYESVARARLKRDLFDQMAAAHDFTLPDSVVEAEYDAVRQQVEAEQGGGPAAAPEGEGKEAEKRPEDDELARECREVAERRVRLGLLLGEVGRQNNLTVSQEELGKALQAEAMRHPGQERQVVEFYQKNPQAMERLRAPILEDKVVDFILEMAEVSERTVSPEELYQAVEERAAAGAGGEAGKKAGGRKKKSEASEENA